MGHVDIVVPVYNATSYVSRMLDTLAQHTPQAGRIVLVDDASPDPTTTSCLLDFQSRRPNTLVLRHGINTRFSRSVVDGFLLTHSSWVAVLNSDLELTPGWLEAMTIACAEDVAVIGCVQHNEVGGLCHSGFHGWAEMSGIHSEPWDVDWVTGAVWLVNRQAWQDIGPLRCDVDQETGTDYRHFESDREWCSRARRLGGRVVMVPHVVTHLWRRSTPPDWGHT